MWDKRYAIDDYRFGTQPNRFLVDCAAQLAPGRVLSLGEGEGRNAVYLASIGYDITAVDSSAIGLAKARRLAKSRGVSITTLTCDLNDYVIEPLAWELIINFFCHLPRLERRSLHQRVVNGLKPGGAYILEVFNPRQPEYGNGGPTERTLLVSLEEARTELAGLELRIARELVRHEEEDDPATKLMAVLQVLAIKPEIH